MKRCVVCGRTGPGARIDGEWRCDNCLNAPDRTRPYLRKKPNGNGRVEGEQSELERLREENARLLAQAGGKSGRVIMGKIMVRDDNEDGPLNIIPQDSDLPDVSAAEIEKAKKEAEKDTRVYVPSDERTLKRIGAFVDGKAKVGGKPARKAGAGRAKGAGKSVKRAGKAA